MVFPALPSHPRPTPPLLTWPGVIFALFISDLGRWTVWILGRVGNTRMFLLFWPRRIACDMHSLAIVITIVQSFSLLFSLRLLLFTHLRESPVCENLFWKVCVVGGGGLGSKHQQSWPHVYVWVNKIGWANWRRMWRRRKYREEEKNCDFSPCLPERTHECKKTNIPTIITTPRCALFEFLM